jgi:hypothetical protein
MVEPPDRILEFDPVQSVPVVGWEACHFGYLSLVVHESCS